MNKIAGLREDGKFTSALTEEQIKIVVDAYTTYEGNEFLAATHSPYTRKTIRKYWKMNGLEVEMGRKKSTVENEIKTQIDISKPEKIIIDIPVVDNEPKIKDTYTFLNKINEFTLLNDRLLL